jgi:hypothetical protein
MTGRDPFGQRGPLSVAGAPVDDQRVVSELTSGERVLWTGKPDSRRWLYPEDVLLVPFSVMWGGFAIFWEASVLAATSAHETTATRLFFGLWGVPFVLIGLYLIFGRVFARRWLRRQTLYALTDRRVLSFSPSWRGRSRVRMIWLSSRPPLEKHIRHEGQGTVCVGQTAPGQRWVGGTTGWPAAGIMKGSAIVLADIPDAAHVYTQITQQIAGADSTAA